MESVKYISATWCKRCHELRPTVNSTCSLLNIPLNFQDYDDLTEEESARITSLPTLYHHVDGKEIKYGAKEIESWTQQMMRRPLPDADF